MKPLIASAVFALLLGGCDSDTSSTPPPMSGPVSMAATAWVIGPIINGVNSSHNMPLRPAQDGDGWSFDFPATDGVHYVTTTNNIPLTATRIRMTFTIAADDAARFVATQGDTSARVRLYFQQAGDDWTTGTARWWSTDFSELKAGNFTIETPLTTDRWSDVNGKLGTDPAAGNGFNVAKANTMNVGMTFGGMFAGHGVFATGPGKFTLQSFSVE